MVSFAATYLARFAPDMFPDLVWRIPTESQTLYLTFDDGPTVRQTESILNILTQFNARATFFLIGKRAKTHKSLVKTIHEAGHTIGNHTYSHPNCWRISESKIVNELDTTTRILEDIVQTPIRWMRPPFGRITTMMRNWCMIRRQWLTMWDVMPGDFLSSSDSSRVERHVAKYMRPGSIIVLHDNDKAWHTPASLRNLLGSLSSEGWIFSSL